MSPKRDKKEMTFFLKVISFFYAYDYSVLNATTGSFFDALLEGMIPAKRVSTTLIATRKTPTGRGRWALRLLIPVRLWSIALMGIQSR